MSLDGSTRRHFLGLLGGVAAVLVSLLPAVPGAADEKTRTVGIALGGGGANGLAHVVVLQTLDEMGLRPSHIAGSSIGAVIGALYASGMSGAEIRGLVAEFFLSFEDRFANGLLSEQARSWLDLVEVELGNGGLLSSEGLIAFLFERLKASTFEELAIPLSVTAADLWTREEIVFDSGPLLPAVQASMALPGVFEPVLHEGRVLVDGGAVNPVPFDLLLDRCDIVVAIDVAGVRTRPENDDTSYFEAVFNSVKVMQQAIVSAKLEQRRPDIYLEPRIVNVRALEFYRADEVFEMARPAAEQLKKELQSLLPGPQAATGEKVSGLFGVSAPVGATAVGGPE